MKKLYILVIPVIVTVFCSAQDPDTLKVENVRLDLLKTPTNPAFLLMNTSPTEIAEPGSAPEFYVSVQNASDNFSALPNNYGFTVTPYWWSKNAKNLSFEKDFDTVNTFTFYRTLSMSGGVVQGIDDNSNWRYAAGFKATLLRGKTDPARKKAYMDALRDHHENYYKNAFLENNPDYSHLETEKRLILQSLEEIDSQLNTNPENAAELREQQVILIGELKQINEQHKVLRKVLLDAYAEKDIPVMSTELLDKKFNEMNDRRGLKWEIGGGVAMNSNNNKVDSTVFYRGGFWSDLGGDIVYGDSSAFNLAGFVLIRYLYHDEIFYVTDESTMLLDDLHLLDAGVKIQSHIAGKFSLGFEAVYRTGITESEFESTYKLNGQFQYHFANNKLVYASLGNQFNDHSTTGPESLVVTVGMNIGFGGDFDVFSIGK